MKRYAKTPIKIDKSGMRVYSTTYYPPIFLNDGDTFIYAKTGDRLDNLAFKAYKDASLWWVISRANDLKGRTALLSGEIIRIPADITGILENFQKINERG
ncbi:hypothetical protein CMI47_22590 [Candidatus Pacearchaeota archaeon]|nr:hypothetical protein [Candidatus Pacearchaeota archaeon]|tara:strand:+ start:935 stop:1234 length:300 start_codon:yes stop_codon:yes gene_type:complete